MTGISSNLTVDLAKLDAASVLPVAANAGNDVWNAGVADQQDEDILHAAASAEPRKDDVGKPLLDLIPPEVIFALGFVLTHGAEKYGARNWEGGMRWGRLFAALMRHLWAWWCGEKADSETGFSHLWHALACLVFLVAYEQRSIGEDDRPPGSGAL